MFTLPTIVTSNDLTKRSYVTFYFNDKRIREYNANSLGLRINPNRANSIIERNSLLEKLRFELHKALEAKAYPVDKINIPISSEESSRIEQTQHKPTKVLLDEALNDKLNQDLSRTYKRDLKFIHAQFLSFLTPKELESNIDNISTIRVGQFLSRFGSSGTYYMNKRRMIGVLMSQAGRLVDKPIKAVKETQKRKVKAKLHEKYEPEQLKPILNYLKVNYHNLYICCLLTYSSWLRPHEEIRLLTCGDFKKDNTEVHLSGNENKGGKVRVVYIPDYVRTELVDILAELPRTANIFSHTDEPFNESYFNTQWSRAWHKMFGLGLIYVNQTIYSFRHTAAVQLYRRTKDVYLLQKLLGHSSIVVTLKYLRTLGEVSMDELREASPTL